MLAYDTQFQVGRGHAGKPFRLKNWKKNKAKAFFVALCVLFCFTTQDFSL